MIVQELTSSRLRRLCTSLLIDAKRDIRFFAENNKKNKRIEANGLATPRMDNNRTPSSQEPEFRIMISRRNSLPVHFAPPAAIFAPLSPGGKKTSPECFGIVRLWQVGQRRVKQQEVGTSCAQDVQPVRTRKD